MQRLWAVVMVLAVSGCLGDGEVDGNNGVLVIGSDQDTGQGADMDDTSPDTGNGTGVVVDDSCVDADGDGAFVDCIDFTGVGEPDCDDTNANVATTCDTCLDADGDGWIGVCDGYDGLQGPDCDDADSANWMACATCMDADSDGYFTGCDSYPMAEDCDDTAASVNPGATEVMDNGVDDDCNPASLDVCDFPAVPAQNPETGPLAGITAAHNHWRARVGLAPMTWNAALATSAKAYADRCIWEHDGSRSPDAGFNYVGENLYASSQSPNSAVVLDSVQAWADERYDYDWGTPIGQTQGAMVGHYTQIVWDDSAEVGCGFANCGSIAGISFGGTVVVCRYGPGGNYTGELPYPAANGACLDLDNDDVFQGADPDDMDRNVR